MSASLVGSEMCIRDRTSPTFAPNSVALPASETDTACGTAGRNGKNHSACLLYTSDAADDM
eukprot:13327629-Alexandrium_andersonii.AAC.1